MKKLLYILSLFILSFTFTGNPPSGWYQQFIPEIGNKPIGDIYFLDSLEGFSGTNIGGNDTNYILKTTNGGDNWFIVHREIKLFQEFSFINNLTGFVCGSVILKTTNAGDSWFSINFPLGKRADDMGVLNEDTILFADANGFDGGVFRTTNGGTSWHQLFSGGGSNPNKIYMYNRNLGFMCRNPGNLFRTTNGGINWMLIKNQTSFMDIYFINEMIGWKNNSAGTTLEKTTNGGLDWNNISLPVKNDSIIFSRINRFSVINKDTIWGVGSTIFFGAGQFRGLIYITRDGGNTWGYQLPDTLINIGQYSYIDFIDENHGWTYMQYGGVHTVTGGDTTIILNIQQISTEIPDDFKLYQNFPNPFNPVTTIRFKVKSSGFITLKVFDIKGTEITTLVTQKLHSGEYKYNFNGSDLASGIYFYSLAVDGIILDTKKMMFIK